MSEKEQLDRFATAAMQAIVQREDFNLIYKSRDNPPALNGYSVGSHGERRVSAEKVIAELAYKIARAMRAESKRQDNYEYID